MSKLDPAKLKVENKVQHRVKREIKRIARNIDRDVIEDYVMYLKSPWQVIWNNFIAGVFRGLGFVVGATILVSLIGWLFAKWLPQLPWVGNFFDQINNEVDWDAISNLVNTIGTVGNTLSEQSEILRQILEKL